MTPTLEHVCDIHCALGPVQVVGPTPSGLRRVIDILSGSFEGPGMRGTLLPGGADWQFIRGDDVTELHAHYMLRTDDGVLIQVKNKGLRHGPAEVLARIAQGEPVDAASYYFRTAPIFEAPAGRYEWLNRSIFVATAERLQSDVYIHVYRVG